MANKEGNVLTASNIREDGGTSVSFHHTSLKLLDSHFNVDCQSHKGCCYISTFVNKAHYHRVVNVDVAVTGEGYMIL